jgi:hypothetical protein
MSRFLWPYTVLQLQVSGLKPDRTAVKWCFERVGPSRPKNGHSGRSFACRMSHFDGCCWVIAHPRRRTSLLRRLLASGVGEMARTAQSRRRSREAHETRPVPALGATVPRIIASAMRPSLVRSEPTTRELDRLQFDLNLNQLTSRRLPARAQSATARRNSKSRDPRFHSSSVAHWAAGIARHAMMVESPYDSRQPP